MEEKELAEQTIGRLLDLSQQLTELAENIRKETEILKSDADGNWRNLCLFSAEDMQKLTDAVNRIDIEKVYAAFELADGLQRVAYALCNVVSCPRESPPKI